MALNATETRAAGGTPPVMSNSPVAAIPGAVVRTLEKLSLRGGPTILLLLWKMPALRRVMATVPLGNRRIRFPAYDPYWCRHLWAKVPYELDVEQIFRRIGRDRVLLDCGANVGYWSIRAPEFGFTDVIAIEANHDLVPILEENFRLNRLPGRVHHAAVYSVSGEQLLLDHTESHAQAGIGDSGLPVTSMTIADAVKHLPPTQQIVAKLDVEGAEIPALQGADTIENIIFVYEDFLRRDMAVTRHLLEHGMTVFGVTGAGEHSKIDTPEAAMAFSSATAAPGGPSNLVACRPEQAAQLENELSSRR